MTAPRALSTRQLLAAALLVRGFSNVRSADESGAAHDEDLALTLEIALLLRLAALDLLAADAADALAFARAATATRDGTLRDAIGPLWASATHATGAMRARWRARLAPILRHALERAQAAFGSPLNAVTLDALAAERADLAAYQVGRTTAAKVTTALRELARAGVTSAADPRVGYRIGHAVDGRGRMPYPAGYPTTGATSPPTLEIGPLVFRDRTLPPPLPIPRPAQRAALVSKFEAAIVARGTFLAALAAGYNRVRWFHDGSPSEPRPHHVALNGAVVVLGETFGRTGLRYPRDPDGDVAEVAGCTCSARYFKA